MHTVPASIPRSLKDLSLGGNSNHNYSSFCFTIILKTTQHIYWFFVLRDASLPQTIEFSFQEAFYMCPQPTRSTWCWGWTNMDAETETGGIHGLLISMISKRIYCVAKRHSSQHICGRGPLPTSSRKVTKKPHVANLWHTFRYDDRIHA